MTLLIENQQEKWILNRLIPLLPFGGGMLGLKRRVQMKIFQDFFSVVRRDQCWEMPKFPNLLAGTALVGVMISKKSKS
jgi:hypothetical protein